MVLREGLCTLYKSTSVAWCKIPMEEDSAYSSLTQVQEVLFMTYLLSFSVRNVQGIVILIERKAEMKRDNVKEV